MNPFLKKIVAATRLTRLGQVSEATMALQRALRATLDRAAERQGMVLDGLVREVDRGPAAATSGTGQDPAAPMPRSDRKSPDETLRAGFKPGNYASTGGSRSYKLFVPAQPAARRSLIVMLHGCQQDPDDFAAGTRMNALAEAQGFYVLYPAQGPRSNAHKCWNWFNPGDQRRGQGEPALIAGMTRQVMEEQGIDPARVYVAGLSAGGAMAAILAREYPDLYAAAGIHSGLPAGAAHDVASAFAAMKTGRFSADRGRADTADAAEDRLPVPVIVFHGDADSTVAPANAEAVIAAALGPGAAVRPVSTAHAGVAHDGGTGGRTYERTVWRDAEANGQPSRAELWRVHAAPHAWSGGAAAGSFTDPAGPDASREMVRFFLEHPLQAARHAAHA